MNAWDGLDRRKFPRVNYPCLIVLHDEKGKKKVLLSHTENIGLGGFALTIKSNVKIFSKIEIELDLLDMEDHLRCHGKVVWSVRRKETSQKKPAFYDVGVEFVDLSDKDRKRLERIVQAMMNKQKSLP